MVHIVYIENDVVVQTDSDLYATEAESSCSAQTLYHAYRGSITLRAINLPNGLQRLKCYFIYGFVLQMVNFQRLNWKTMYLDMH